MEAVTDVDVTGAESFEALLAWAGQRDVVLAFSRVRPDARKRLEELGLLGDRSSRIVNWFSGGVSLRV